MLTRSDQSVLKPVEPRRAQRRIAGKISTSTARTRVSTPVRRPATSIPNPLTSSRQRANGAGPTLCAKSWAVAAQAPFAGSTAKLAEGAYQSGAEVCFGGGSCCGA